MTAEPEETEDTPVDNSTEAANDATSGMVNMGAPQEQPAPPAAEQPEATEQLPKQTWEQLVAKAKKPNWSQFVENARSQSTFAQGAKQALTEPARWLYGESPIGRVAKSFGQTYQEAGTEALNQDFLSPEIQKSLQEHGSFKNYMDENDIINKGWMDGTIVPATKTFMSAMDAASIQYLINPIRALGSVANAEMQGTFEAIKAAGVQGAREAFGRGGIDVLGTHINPEDIAGASMEYLTQSADPLIAGAYHVNAEFGSSPVPARKPMPVAAAKLIAEGAVDEGVWTGEHEPTEAQQTHMREAAKQLPRDIYDNATPHEGSFINPDTDIHSIARTIDPEALERRNQYTREHDEIKAQYDALREQKNADAENNIPHEDAISALEAEKAKLKTATSPKARALQAQIDELTSKQQDYIDEVHATETPEMEALKRSLQENFDKRVELAKTGRVQAAYQAAEQKLPRKTVEFEEPEFEKAPESKPAVDETAETKTERPKTKPIHYEVTGAIHSLDKPITAQLIGGPDRGGYAIVDDQESIIPIQNMLDAGFTKEEAIAQALTGKKDASSVKLITEAEKPVKPDAEQHASIVADATKQLVEIGRPLENAQAEAEVVADAYMTRAARWEGRKGTGEELYRANFPIVKAAVERSPNKAREIAQRVTGRELEQSGEFKSSGDAIDEGTKYLIEKAKEKGLTISDINQSKNRYGGRSNYFSISSDYTHSSVRISDHSKNENFRTENTSIIGNDAVELQKQADAFIDKFSKAVEAEKDYFKKADELKADESFMSDYRAYKKASERVSQFQQDKRRGELENKYGISGYLNKKAFVDRLEGRELEQSENEKPTILSRVKSLFSGKKELSQQARGKIRLGVGNVRSVITLFKNANASTFMHEMGHHFLDQLQKDAADPDAPESIKRDWKTVSEWLGHEGGDIKTRHHEKFARGFERYLMEGIAPSKKMARVFHQFKQWLTQIYGTVKRLKSPINDDIRNVFDRMLSENPEKTVYAAEAEPGKMLADIHEEDGKNITHENAPEIRDTVRKEVDRTAIQHEPEVHDAIKDAEVGKLPEAVGVAKPSGSSDKARGVPEQPTGKTSPSQEPDTVGDGGATGGAKSNGIEPATPKSFVFARVPREPTSLSAYVKKLGGIKDVGGDVLNTIGEKRQFPGLISDKGRELDYLAEKAWEDGYFSEKGEQRPSINEFLDKLETDIKGAKQYSEHDAGKLKDYEDAVRHNSDIQKIADDLGITTFKSAKEFWDEVAAKTSQQESDRLAEELTSHLNNDYQDMVDAEKDYLDSLGDRESEPDTKPRTEKELEDEREQERLAAEAQTRGEDTQGQRPPGTQSKGSDRVRQGGGDTDADRPEGPNAPYRPSSDLVDKAGNIRLENLTDNESLREAMRDAAKQNPDLFNHDVIPDREVADMCRAMGVAENAENIQKLRNMTVNDGIPLAVRIKAGRQALIDQCKVAMDAMDRAKTGTQQDLLAFAEARNKFLMIAETVSSITNEWGRAGRAFRDISKEEMSTADQMKDLFQRMTGQSDAKIAEMAKEGAILDTPAKAAKFMQESKKPDFWDKIVWYRVNCLISGPETHMRYGIGNFIREYLYDPLILTPIQAGIGSAKAIAGLENEDRVYWGEVSAKLFALTKGSADGLRAAATAWRENQSPTLPGEAPYLHKGFQPTSLPGKAIGVPGRSVGSIHSFYKQVGYEQNIQALAYRQATKENLTGSAKADRIAKLTASPTPEMMDAAIGKDPAEVIARQIAKKEGISDDRMKARIEQLKTNPTPEMREAIIQANIIKDATAKALGQVYMSRTDSTTTLGKLNAAVNSSPLLKIMIPFMKIGTQIDSQAILEGSPLGLLHPKIRDDLMGKNGGAKADEAWGKIAAGAALMGSTVYMFSQGKVTGDGPQDPAKRAVWLMTHKPHSVQIGGMWFSYQGLGYLGVQMKMMANMCEAAQETEGYDVTKAAGVFFESIAKSVLDDNWMRGVKDTLDAVFDFQKSGQRWINDFATSWLPFSVGMQQTARLIDPEMREAKGLPEAAMNKIPYVSEGLYPRRDVFGEPIPSNHSIDRYKNDPVAMRLNALGKGISPPDRTIMGQPLTEKQWDEYSKLAGRLLKQRLDALIGAKGFDRAPAGVQIKEIQKQISASRSNARAAMIQQYPDIPLKAQAEKQRFMMTGTKH